VGDGKKFDCIFGFSVKSYVRNTINLSCAKILLTSVTEKKTNLITFYFVEEDPGCGSEDIKKECNVNCFDFFFFSVFLMDVMGGKIKTNLIELH